MENKKYGILSSSADPEKLGMTIRGVLVLLIAAAGFFGVDVAAVDPDLIVGGIVRLVAIVVEGIGIIMLLYGIARKIGLKKWN